MVHSPLSKAECTKTPLSRVPGVRGVELMDSRCRRPKPESSLNTHQTQRDYRDSSGTGVNISAKVLVDPWMGVPSNVASQETARKGQKGENEYGEL